MKTDICFDIDDDAFDRISKFAMALDTTVEQIIEDYLYLLAGQPDNDSKQ